MSPPAVSTRESFVQALAREVRDIRDRARELFSDLDGAQLAWSPTQGAWGVGACLEHLIRTNHLYLRRMDRVVTGLPKVERPEDVAVRGGAVGRWFTRLVGPSSRVRLEAPRIFRPRTSASMGVSLEPPPDHVVRRFLEQQDRILNLLEKAAGRPLDEARVPSPAFRLFRLRISDGLRAMVAHQWRHLAQAERVMGHPDFPRGMA